MPSTHYVAMSGEHGCSPQFCCSCDTALGAVDALVDLHELGRRRRAELKRTMCLELNPRRDGAEYCEIVECSCDTPDVHDA